MGGSAASVACARGLRRRSTDAERVLWHALRNRQVEGAKFRRQHPVAGYVADFACFELRLIIEADGGQHAGSAADLVRTARLAAEGWVVVRFWNDEVLGNLAAVVGRVAEVVRERRG